MLLLLALASAGAPGSNSTGDAGEDNSQQRANTVHSAFIEDSQSAHVVTKP